MVPLVLLSAMVGGCVGAIPAADAKVLTDANAAYQGGDDKSAVQLSAQFIQMHPQAPEAAEAYYIRGLARLRMGLTPDARDDFNAALGLTKRADLTAQIHLALADMSYKANDMATASTHYQAALAGIPQGQEPADRGAFYLGCALQRLGQWPDADVMFHRVMHFFESGSLAKLAEDRAGATKWSIQAGAYDNAAAADELVAKLKATGISARQDRQARGGKLLRLVRVGSFPTYDAAAAELPKVAAACQEAFLVPAR
jgi:TolA-binding protein